MKICHLITRMIFGGAQENTLLTLQGLKRDTPWELHLACGPEIGKEGSLLEETRALGVKIHILPHLRRNLDPLNDFLAYHELFDFFSKERFNLVHTHSSKAGILGRIAARNAGIQNIVHTIHGVAFDQFQPSWRNALYIGAERIAAAHCDKILSVCDAMTSQALAVGIGNRAMMHTVRSGFPLDPYLAITPRVKSQRFVLGVIARMFELKGHEDVMKLAPRILKDFEDVDFHIVGDGPLRTSWDKWMDLHPQWKNRIAFAGRVPVEKVPQELEKMDLLLHLSWREGLARTLPQALAASRVVITYDVGGASEIVINGETGWSIPAGDLEKVFEAIAGARASPRWIQTMAAKGRERVAQLYSIERMQASILEIYKELGAAQGII